MLAMRFLEGEGTFTCVPQSPLVLQMLLPQPVNLHSKKQKVGDAVSHHQNSQFKMGTAAPPRDAVSSN